MEDARLCPESYQPMRCHDPNPLIERAEGHGECEHGRKFFTDLCAHVKPVPEDSP